MESSGGCHCGRVRYVAEGPPEQHALCHCQDCRRWSGAPMSGWIAFRADRVRICGEPVCYESSTSGRRDFCGHCGSGLFYRNGETLPGLIDIQSGTLDDPAQHAPNLQFMTCMRLAWMDHVDRLPQFLRYPPA